MNEQIFLNGAPVVGFGDSDMSITNPTVNRPLIGFAVGAIGGTVAGHSVKKGVGTVVGAVLGGLGGALIGAATAMPQAHAAESAKSEWQPVTDPTQLKAGQQIAMAVVGPNGTFPADKIAQFNMQIAALATAPVNLPTGNFVSYPPGAQLPHDWPSNDNLGSGAYRIMFDMVTDAPPEAGKVNLSLPSGEGAIKAWARTKPAAPPAVPPSPAPTPTPQTPPPPPAMPAPAMSGWRPVQTNSLIKAGQQLAISIAGLNGLPLPPEIIADGTDTLTRAGAAAPGLHLSVYPPGTLLPLDWPEDDDLGPSAYRYMMNALVDAPLQDAAELPTGSTIAMFKAWARDKS